jgi:hypothetical protein
LGFLAEAIRLGGIVREVHGTAPASWALSVDDAQHVAHDSGALSIAVGDRDVRVQSDGLAVLGDEPAILFGAQAGRDAREAARRVVGYWRGALLATLLAALSAVGADVRVRIGAAQEGNGAPDGTRVRE